MEQQARIGRYRIEEKLGRGGMGDVYLGYDEMLERKVALKCIKADHRLDEEAKARFLREAKVLSQLGHPDICQIYDYVEGEDADFLVLELISGRRLSDVIGEGRLSRRQKLLLAGRIANVLEVAHQKGIIHRDLKPDNIIMADDHDIKVLDFGLARQLSACEPAISAAGGPGRKAGHVDETITIGASSGESGSKGLTTVGVIMGTLGYMSPEQARGEDVTASSDMYSLGILLEELFSGKQPVEKELSFEALLEKNQKGERVTPPVDDSDIASLVKDLTALDPLARLTAREASQKITAIIEKPARKRKRIIVASVIALLTLSTLAATVFWIRALRSERRAREEAAAAKAVSGFLVGLFEVTDPGESRGKTVTAKEVLDRGVGDIDRELKEQPKIKSELMQTMGSVYSNLGLYKEARPLFEKSLALSELCFGKVSPETAEILAGMGKVSEREGRYSDAESSYERALETYKKLPSSRRGGQLAELMANVADIWQKQGKYKEALGLYKQSLSVAEQSAGPMSLAAGRCYGNIGSVNDILGNYGEAEKMYLKTYDIFKLNYGETHPEMAILLNNIAATYESQGKLDAAEEYYLKCLDMKEKLYGPDHDSIANTLNNLGYIYSDQKKFDKAEEAWTRALNIWKEKFGGSHPYVAIGCYSMARVLKYKGDYAKSEEYYLSAVDTFEKVYGRDSNECSMAYNGLGSLYRLMGRDREAEAACVRAVAIGEKKMGPEHPDVLNIALNLADFYREKKQFQKAGALLKKYLSVWEQKKDGKEKGIKDIMTGLVRLYEDEGARAEAVKCKKRIDEIDAGINEGKDRK